MRRERATLSGCRRAYAFVAVFAALISCASVANAGQTWDGGGGDNNWSTGANWSGDTTPAYGTLIFAGSVRTTNVQNLGNPLSMHRIDFTSSSPFTLDGNPINFFDFGGQRSRIETQGTGAATINFTVNFADTSGSGGFAEINPVNADLTFGSTVNMTGSQVNEIRVFGSNGKIATFNGAVTGSSRAFVLRNASEVVFNASNTYNGDTTIEAGTVSYGQGGQTSSPFHRVGVIGGTAAATLRIIDTDGGTTLNNGIVIRSGTGARRLHATNTSGTNGFAGNVFLDGDVSSTVPTGGTLQFSGGNIDLKNQTFTVGGAGNTVVTQGFDNPTGGETGNLIKSDGGTLYMNGASTYRGTTIVNGGRLLVNAAHTGGGQYTVNSNATLGGTGSIPNNVVINNGGKLAAGASIGTLTINGNLTFNATSILEYEVDADGPLFDADLTIATGGVDVSGAELRFVFTPATLATLTPGKTFIIVRKDSAGSPSGPFAALPALSPELQYTISYAYSGTDDRGAVGDGNDIAVTFTAVPEPSIGLALFGLLALRRRS